MASDSGIVVVLARSPREAPRWLSRTAAVLAALYLSLVVLEAAGSRLPRSLLPRPLLFFVQTASLFPRAARNVIEWRARGWRCDAQRFEEIDVRPYFPIHAGDKENRFARAMFFYLREPKVLAALDRYIVEREAARGNRLGGVMLLSLRLPLPEPGSTPPPHRYRPIDDYPRTVERRYWYVTPAEQRDARCREAPR